jgi:DNA polymerase III subunit delta'
MNLPQVIGHEAERLALARAHMAGELPGTLLFHGPPGIGKQRLALWLGQLLLCEAPKETGPCGACAHCRLTQRLEHPDLHWFFPIPRPKGASGPDRLADALEEARAAELAVRRAEPWRPIGGAEMAGLFLGQMQTLRRIASSRPAMARRKLFIVGDAERLVPQESSPEAANALLKLLEEPPADTTIVLTAADGDGLLPTIRSRLLAVRIHPLPEPAMHAFLQERGVASDRATAVARLANGSIGAALAFLPVGGSPGPLESIRQQSRDWLAAAVAADPAQTYALAIAQAPAGARGSFTDALSQLTLWLRDLAAVSSGAEDVVLNTDALPWLRELSAELPGAARRLPAALAQVDAVMHWAQSNINPQLALAWLLSGLRRELRG